MNNFKKISEYLREEIVEFRLEVMEFTEQHGVEVIKKPLAFQKAQYRRREKVKEGIFLSQITRRFSPN